MYKIGDVIITTNYYNECEGNDNHIQIIGVICKIIISKGEDQLGRDKNFIKYSIYNGSFTLTEDQFTLYEAKNLQSL